MMKLSYLAEREAYSPTIEVNVLDHKHATIVSVKTKKKKVQRIPESAIV